MNRQEIFDRSCAGIVAQGGPSVSKNGKCLYRGPNGRKCAAGHLIPDETYSKKMEGNSSFGVEIPGIEEYTTFVRELQIRHDRAAETTSSDAEFLKIWVPDTAKFARSLGLNDYSLLGG